ncbi:unnamed protein product [Sphacelaria rigidula]
MRPHMLHAPPPLNYGPGVPAAGAGPAYLRKHSFFDLDEDEDDEVFDAAKKEALSTPSGSAPAAGSSPSGRSVSATGYGSAGPQKGTGSGATSNVSPASPSPPGSTGSFAAPATSPDQTAATVEEAGGNNETAGGRLVDGVGGGGGGGAHGSSTPLMRGGRRTVAGAMERRRMLLACRTLRAQINHYEAAFQQEYGHAPKGRERSPLVSTYAQYKSWKKFIRDDASTQIQSFYRGYRERNHHPEVPRLLRKNAPPPPPPPPPLSVIPGQAQQQQLSQQQQQQQAVGGAGGSLSPPAVVPGVGGGLGSAGGAAPPSPSSAVSAKGGLSSALSPTPAQHSPQQQKTAVTGAGVVGAGAGAGGGGGGVGFGAEPPPSLSNSAGFGATPGSGSGVAGGGMEVIVSGAVATSAPTAPGGAGGMTAEEEVRVALTTRLTHLLDEKRRIKAQLKEFDMNFFGRSGRLPTKAEKEPMRHLYDKYNGLKHQIRDVEGLLVAHRQQHSPHMQYTPPQSPYTASPRSGWSTASSTGGAATTPAATPSTTTPAAIAEAVTATAAAVGSGERGSGSVGGASAAERLEQLKKEKRVLHVMLKNFEKDFKERNGREVCGCDG